MTQGVLDVTYDTPSLFRIAFIVECSSDGGAEFRVFRYPEPHSVEFLHGWEHLAALRQQGEVADEHEILDARFER